MPKFVADAIPKRASVSGPDYLGAHLSMRETYAIFPALHNQADYVIVDVFAQKILRILGLNASILRDIVAEVVKDENYSLVLGCGNLFIFENVGEHAKPKIFPIQERFEYDEVYDFEILKGLKIVDYEFPSSITRGEVSEIKLVYTKSENSDLDSYIVFTTFVNSKTGETYQAANLPSFSLLPVGTWKANRYYMENLEIALPRFLDNGDYKVFVGVSNKIKTRSVYLNELKVK